MEEFGDALWRLTAGYASTEAERKDLHQDILAAIWQALGRFRQESSLRTFVYRIAHNRGVSHRAYERRRTHGSLEAVAVAALGRRLELRRQLQRYEAGEPYREP